MVDFGLSIMPLDIATLKNEDESGEKYDILFVGSD